MKIRYWLYKLLRTKQQAELEKLSPFLIGPFAKVGIDLAEYKFYGKKLTVGQVNEVLAAGRGVIPGVDYSEPDPEKQWRLREQFLYNEALHGMVFKNQLLELGLMEQDVIDFAKPISRWRRIGYLLKAVLAGA